MAVTETRQEMASRENTPQIADAKAEIVNYSFRLLKQGYAKSTIIGRTKLLKRLLKLGANLWDSENVKEIIAQQSGAMEEN